MLSWRLTNIPTLMRTSRRGGGILCVSNSNISHDIIERFPPVYNPVIWDYKWNAWDQCHIYCILPYYDRPIRILVSFCKVFWWLCQAWEFFCFFKSGIAIFICQFWSILIYFRWGNHKQFSWRLTNVEILLFSAIIFPSANFDQLDLFSIFNRVSWGHLY